jgi:membrane-associated protease RseP (regulator of RpoE activity)
MRHWRNILAAAVLATLPALAAPVDADDAGSAASANPTTTPAPLAHVLASPDIRAQFWFGVAVENLPPSIARQLKLKSNQGLMVTAVLPGSPAAKAGLQTDDILTEINDAPLTTQNDLYLAANPVEKGKVVPEARPSQLTFLRNGDRTTVQIKPEPRPADMVVFDGSDRSKSGKVRNYAMPSGGGAQVATGYLMNLATSAPGDFTAKSIKAIVSKGQTIILTRDTDVSGKVKNTITVGTAVYEVDASNVDALPPELQPLGRQLLANSPPSTTTTKPAETAPPATTALTVEERLKVVEEQNAELRRQIDALKRSSAAPGK